MEEAEYIVGVGASAGGLDAINLLFDNMPENTGAAFIVVQHLSPDYKSLMSELLAKHTLMKVHEAAEGVKVKPNCVYLIPPKKAITVKEGKIKLHNKEELPAINFAIDTFLESLAKEKGKNALAIILSGTGTDGTKGVEQIHNNGGFVIVQDPMSSLFDGMPNSAINSGFTDLVLTPDMMAEEVVNYMKEAPMNRLFSTQEDQDVLQDVLTLVKRITSHDFSQYKRSTIYRRIAKRMMEINYRSIKEYYGLLLNNPDEVKNLLKDLLINVTRFFRDEDAFEIIKAQVIPAIFSTKKEGDTIKLWVTACSSGEEAYSLAILFEEYRERHKVNDIHVKIFATDIDTDALEMASKAIYSKDQLANVSQERINKYFDQEGDKYKVIASLRKMVVVAKHDIIHDPPFSRLDFISCRNMLIYMNPVLQKNILRTFHFALGEGAYLFLGPSENIDLLKDAMREVDRKWKIFKCIRKINLQDHRFLITPLDKESFYKPMVDSKAKSKNALHNLLDIFRETLAEDYSFAGIFIDREFEVKQAIGNFKDFLDFPEGQFNFNLLKMVPQELGIPLGAAVRKAVQQNEVVKMKRVKLHEGKRVRLVNLVVKPYLQQNEYIQPFLFVILNEEPEAEKKKAETTVVIDNVPAENHLMADELEKELKETRENLQAVIEELESANEELQSHTEEMITSNEELQTTNEELQSLNEELHTVSTEHQMKIKELLELNDDLNNYFRTSNVGQMLIDRRLIIRRFSPAITQQINLVDSDLGRSIVDFSTKVRNVDFVNDIKEVIGTGNAVEKEVELSDDKIFLMRINPYVRIDKSIDGVVVNFFDITELRKLTSIVESVFNSSLNGIVALKAIRDRKNEIVDFEYIAANTMAESILGKDSLIGKRLLVAFPEVRQEDFYAYKKVVETSENIHFENYLEDTGRSYEMVAVKMQDGIVITFNDVTDRKKSSDLIEKGYEELKDTSKKLLDANAQLEQSNFDLMQFASVASHDLKEPLRKIQVFGDMLQKRINSSLAEPEREFLERIIHAANRMQKLIEDILTLSKLSNRDTPFVNTNLNSILAHLIDDIEITIKEKNAVIKIDKLPEIDALSGQMHQLFQNLIMNGLKFNSHEKPVISITSSTVNKQQLKELGLNVNNDYVQIIVADNGIGFEEKYKEKIFGIFQRLNSNQFPGTGIGLAISKKIVDNHGGVISAESEVDKGSRFIIILPLHNVRQEENVKALSN